MNNIDTPREEGKEDDMQRLYDWLMDENRKKAQTFFTSSPLRNVAKEIEFRLASLPVAASNEAVALLKERDEEYNQLLLIKENVVVERNQYREAFEKQIDEIEKNVKRIKALEEILEWIEEKTRIDCYTDVDVAEINEKCRQLPTHKT
jgi:tRNA(Phe) wybutosine-synthesizing methylase Tyw3